MTWSAGVSTTHSTEASRRSSRQVSQTSCSVKVLQRWQWRICPPRRAVHRPACARPRGRAAAGGRPCAGRTWARRRAAPAALRPVPAARSGTMPSQWRSERQLEPGGSGRPEVIEPIFSCEVASALRTASLKAAATRSSSRSLSSPSASRLGSMVTRLTSFLQVMTTLTRPAPDWPSTSIRASCSCIFFMFSCICWACFISPAS